eukprot:TRINITY_DN3071_c2_g1_i1.p1 TRINITY_DN3071_c2_g1~~TRINITY_DN3071_c2_g1_i1.p1  ORF type:complete len:653 (+),score=209.98 TRINITY_DN3071_c2_g1_i1:193-1959(+)
MAEQNQMIDNENININKSPYSDSNHNSELMSQDRINLEKFDSNSENNNFQEHSINDDLGESNFGPGLTRTSNYAKEFSYSDESELEEDIDDQFQSDVWSPQSMFSSNSNADFFGGTTLNAYVFVRELGEGSFGKVRLVQHRETKEYYSMKQISKGKLMKQGRFSQNNPWKDLEREIAIMKKLNHPNVLSLKNVFDTNEYVFLLTEYVDGGSLMEALSPLSDDDDELACLNSMKPLDPMNLWQVVRGIVSGLKYIHSQGIIHRDIKPANILVKLCKPTVMISPEIEDEIKGSESNDSIESLPLKLTTVKLADFGVSQDLLGTNGNVEDSKGTPVFEAPEIASGQNNDINGFDVDIWALGVTVYCLAIGKLPFYHANLFTIMQKIVGEDPEIPPDLEVNLDDFIRGLLQKDPKERLKIDEICEHPYITANGEMPLDSHFGEIIIDSDDVSNAVTKLTDEDVLLYRKIERRLSTIGDITKNQLLNRRRWSTANANMANFYVPFDLQDNDDDYNFTEIDDSDVDDSFLDPVPEGGFDQFTSTNIFQQEIVPEEEYYEDEYSNENNENDDDCFFEDEADYFDYEKKIETTANQ